MAKGKKGNNPTPNEGYSHSGGHMGPSGHKPPGGMAHHTSSGDGPHHAHNQESAHVKAHRTAIKHVDHYAEYAKGADGQPLGSGGKFSGGAHVSDPDGVSGND